MISESIETWREQLPGSGCIVGLDHGTKIIGVAASDVGRSIASPVSQIERRSFKAVSRQLSDIIAARDGQGLVIGLPINMNGSEGPRCESARAFADNLDQAFALPILLWDERMSTQAVTRRMIEADLSRRKRRTMVDKMAAAYILQGVLDAMAFSGPLGS